VSTPTFETRKAMLAQLCEGRGVAPADYARLALEGEPWNVVLCRGVVEGLERDEAPLRLIPCHHLSFDFRDQVEG
jgi:hypothetical protein